jgi:hypothetical protein
MCTCVRIISSAPGCVQGTCVHISHVFIAYGVDVQRMRTLLDAAREGGKKRGGVGYLTTAAH